MACDNYKDIKKWSFKMFEPMPILEGMKNRCWREYRAGKFEQHVLSW